MGSRIDTATALHDVRVPECGAIGPERRLWGYKTNLRCSLPRGHWGDHCDQLITGYSEDGWFRR